MAALKKMKQQWPILLDDDFMEKVQIAQFISEKPPLGLLITDTDEVYAIGTDQNGYFGFGPVSAISNLVRVNALCDKKIQKFASRSTHILALSKDGIVYSWGYNGYGQLGNDTTTNSKEPIEVAGDLKNCKVVEIACGSHHSMALTSKGEAYAWGYNANGRTGLDVEDGVTKLPRLVATLKDEFISSISADNTNSFFLSMKGNVYSCGNNSSGSLGLGSGVSYRRIPTQIPRNCMNCDQIEQIASGYLHTLAVTTTGCLLAWGYNACGEVGNGTSSNVMSPVKITAAPHFDVRIMSISTNHETSSAIDTDGNIYIWGYVNGTNLYRPTKITNDRTALPDLYSRRETVSNIGQIVTDLTKAFNDQDTADLTIVVHDKSIFVHKSILQIRSPYFNTMFRGKWKETESNKLVLKSYSYDMYLALIKYIYTGKLDDVHTNIVLQLFEFSHAALDEPLKLYCSQYLQKALTLDNVVGVFSTAWKVEDADLVNLCVRFAMRNMKEVLDSQEFENMAEGPLKAFLKKGAYLGMFAY